MEPEIQPPVPSAPLAGDAMERAGSSNSSAIDRDSSEYRGLLWIFSGSQGLRAGWSVSMAYLLYKIFTLLLGNFAVELDPALARASFSPGLVLIEELIPLLAILAAFSLIALIERQKSVLAYNLAGPRRSVHFCAGLMAGFTALSALAGALAWGGWLHFGVVALNGAEIFRFGALWAGAFLLVGLFEEGVFRCYLQFTLTRGINFWWALGIVCTLCLDLLLRSNGYAGILAIIGLDSLPALKSNGVWGVYGAALLGLPPCLLLHIRRAPGAAFWQAAWVTSTLFGFIHLGNNGENWIGIFAAATIGFVFCVSVRLTGSAWWAIGCHAAWDWGETFFYGAADSGNVASGHYLTTTPAGNALWSGGSDGPEGSLLVLAVILLLLVALLAIYGRNKPAAPGRAIAEPVAG
jgi:membrane protease YdiL (CAAX protease family)